MCSIFKESQVKSSPPGKLPITFFNADWLKDVDDDYYQIMLEVSKEDFPWKKFKLE